MIHVLRAHDRAPRILREELERARIHEEIARPARIDSIASIGTPSIPIVDVGPMPVGGTQSMPVGGTQSMPVGGVLHSYSGGAELVDVYRELGMAFSFAGPVSYANARKPVEAARLVPEDLLLAETDAPDQAPEGHRGGRSEPAFVAAVIAALAAARGTTAEEIGALTTANAQRIFGAWPSSTTTRE